MYLHRMARSFDEVLAEVSRQSDPQRKTVLDQISQLPTQQAAEETALGAKKDQAYSDILDGARRRGLGFSGIPLGEQAKYNATDYAPALANLGASYNNRKSTLETSLADYGKQDYSTAYNIYNQDRQFEEQQRQFNEQMAENQRQQAAARSASAGSYLGAASGSAAAAPQQGQTLPQISQRADKGFNFTDSSGKTISAAMYAQLTGSNFFDLLGKMSASGDSGAAQYLKAGGSVSPALVRALTWR